MVTLVGETTDCCELRNSRGQEVAGENLPSAGTHAHAGPPCPDPHLSAEATVKQQGGKVLPGRIRAGAHSLQMTPQGSNRMGDLSPLRHPTMSPLSGRSSSGGRTRLALHSLVSLCFRCGFCKQPPVGFCLLIQLGKFCSLVGALNPLLCNIIVDILRFEYTILFLLVFVSLVSGRVFFPAHSVVGFESFSTSLTSLNI